MVSAQIAANNVADLIQGMAGFGERTALRYRTEYRGFGWSYRRLYGATVQMARFLQEQGIRPGERVMLWAPDGPPWIVAFLGILLNGCVAVPIDLRSRPPFLRDVARETDTRLLVRTRFKPDPGLGVPTVFSEDLEERLAGYPTAPPALPSPGGGDMAEIVYTSGTVARPKGVIITHGNVAAELRSAAPIVPPEPEYRFLTILPFSHIFAQVVDLFLPISRGATIVTLETVKPGAIATALRRERVTVLAAVPRLLELLRSGIVRSAEGNPLRRWPFALFFALAPHLSLGWRQRVFGSVHRDLAPDLKYVVSGGAALDPDVERFWDYLGFLTLQGYGLTETTAAVSADRVDARRIGSVGKVLPGQEVRIAEQGEILVRGPNVTPGYFANAAATAAAFEDGWFRTGDVGYFDRDGFLYIRGRLKEVIVTSAGVNVYPEDVEAVLDRQPGVRDSAVVEWQRVVHAVLLLQPGTDPYRVVAGANKELDSAQQIQAFSVWPFPDFPRTPILKVRKRDVIEYLAQHELREEAAELVRAPGTRLEALIASLSPAPPTALRPNATLGLDLQLSSLDRLELISLIEQELNVDIADEEVTGDTTVAELERMVEARRPQRRGVFPRWARRPFVRALRSFLQRGLLFPLLRRIVHLRVAGEDNLAALRGPCIFAANHQTDLDAPIVEMALPEAIRRRTAVAAWEEFFLPRTGSWPFRLVRNLMYYAVVVLVNAFPLSHTHVVRSSIQYMGELVEEGENILIFPEGRRSTTGEMLPFEQGIGLIANALRVPIVPVRLEGVFDILPGDEKIPRPGPATVKFGPPLTFTGHESYLDVARRVQEAVGAL